ncbi:hypothetical protein OAH08_02775 [Verrucomicrobia bacterium]|nr:hypothetical protein [Verrucomicrobiota bacterium]
MRGITTLLIQEIGCGGNVKRLADAHRNDKTGDFMLDITIQLT